MTLNPADPDAPKVLVGCPTWEGKEYCLAEYAEAVKRLNYPNYDVLIADNTKKDRYLRKLKEHGLAAIKTEFFAHARDRLVHGRNVLRKKVLDEGYDYLFSLEQDVIPPLDGIQRLMSHGKKICSGLYSTYQNINGNIRMLPLLFMQLDEAENRMRYLTEQEISLRPSFLEVRACGLGCVLIHRDVLERVEFRYSKAAEGFDDVFFCEDALKAGFKIYADTSIRCKHVYGGGWDGIKK